MSAKKTLLKNSDYPDYCSCHVRDPKVWEENGRYRMVLGARTLDNKGCVLYYSSDDLNNWKYEKTVFGSDGSYMWECPDEFTLDNHRFLSVSPQGIPHQKYVFQNVYSSGYFNMDGETPENYREWDNGFDFYAPQTFDAIDGRKILIGWQGIGDIPYFNATTKLGWQHCLTIPRELTADKSGNILQQPVREIKNLRRTSEKISAGESTKVQLPFEYEGDNDGDYSVIFDGLLKIEYREDELSLLFTNGSVSCGRTVRYAKIKDSRNIRIIADMSSVEIYANDGELVISSRMYPNNTELSVAFSGTCGVLYELDGMEVEYSE